MSETAEQKYNRLASEIQEAILKGFPNPDRRNCPGTEKVKEVAARESIVEDDVWQHITHCSPCYREFLDQKSVNRGARQSHV